MSSTALLRLCRAGVLGVALSGVLLATPVFADGGNSGSFRPGGIDNPDGAGGDGTPLTGTNSSSGSGGGAGTTGGNGGADTDTSYRAQGGQTAGADGEAGRPAGASATAGGGGGGGGAHGWVNTGLPTNADFPGGVAQGGRGGDGGTGGDITRSSSTGGGGGAGGYGAALTGSSSGTLSVDASGGDGGNGGDTGAKASKGGNGGSGGEGFYATATPTLTIGSQVTGGRGGVGGSGTATDPTAFSNDAGDGGHGGDGVLMNSGGTVTVTQTVKGGDGGDGGHSGNNEGNPSLFSSTGGLGGTGGAGLVMNGSGIIIVDGTMIGGHGGKGGDANGANNVWSGAGGAGGAGLIINAASTVTVNGAVTGGDGGQGGSAALGINSFARNGGAGGAGIIGADFSTITVTHGATVTGGNGGSTGSFVSGSSVVPAAGVGGAGITGQNLKVVNAAGIITGGLSGDASPVQANAVTFTGGNNVYETWYGASVNGNVVDQTGNGTFRLGGAHDESVDASILSMVGGLTQYQGFKHLDKTGSSTWTVTGNSTYVEDITVTQGFLKVDGSLNSVTQTTVNANAKLYGAGSLGGTVNIAANGVFAPGDLTPGSSMTVQSLALASGAKYMVYLNPTTSSFAHVTNTAILGGATVDARFLPGSYINKQYTILTASGGFGGTTFDSVVNSNNATLQSTLSYDANNVLLNIQLVFNPPTGGLNANQQNVANTFINFFNTTGGIPGAFSSLTPKGMTQASGELGTAPQQTTFQAMNLFLGLMTDPFSAGRGFDVNGGGANSAAGFADEESMAYAGRAKSKSPRDAFAAFTKAPPAVFAQRWNVWAAGYGGSQTTDGNAVVGSNNTTSAVYGGVAGADYWFSPDTVAGFALAGGGSNFSVANGGSGRSDMFQAGAFVRHNFDATYLTAAVAYGWQDVTTDRYVSAMGTDHLRANFNANAYSGRLEFGHRFLTPWFGGLGVSPYAAAQIIAFELPSYAERAISGASTFALNYGGDTTTSSRTELGLRTDKSYALDGAVLTLRGRAAWAHDFNPDRTIGATFQTLPGASFVVNGAALASETALTTASAEVRWMNGWSVAATFEGEFSDVTRSYAGKGVLRYSW